MKKTGIMGGSFNPIHFGHLEIAECALKEYALEEILFIPNSCPPHKSSAEMEDVHMRLEMVNLAIQGNPRFSCSDREIKKGGLSFTYETMTELKEEEPDTEFYFLMGADSLKDFRKWKNAKIITEKCKILAAMRDEMDDRDVMRLAKELSAEYRAEFFLLKIPPTNISSTQIRENIRQGQSISGLVPAEVETYIQKHHLYRG